MRRLALLAFLAAPGLLACQRGVPADEAVASITEADFLHKVGIIAHDSMMGRYNPSPGLTMTAEWIAEEFEKYGLEPGGDDGSFIQAYKVRELAMDFEGSSAEFAGGPSLEFGTDVYPITASAGGASGPVALIVGNLADAQDLPPEQLSGKHLVIVPSASAQTSGRRRIRFPRGLTNVQPASVIMVDQSSDEAWAEAVDRSRNRTQRLLPWNDGAGGGPAMLSIREGVLGSVLADHGIQLSSLMARGGGAVAVVDVPSLELTVNTATQELDGFDMPNTVAILEGSDPTLKNEYIVYSGHMDHVAPTTPNEAGDSIRNGADDDASGTIAVVELAEAFSMMAERPKRSMVFLAVSGEESGLWGSRFYAENPGVAPGELVANLNADMISRNAPDSIVVIGKEHSDLGETLNRVNAEHPELNLTASDDIWPDQNFYRRSDHFNFARRGVPVLFFFCGIHEDYHGVDDEVEKMDITKATNVTKLMFHLGLELGNAAEKPQWDPASYEEIVDMGG